MKKIIILILSMYWLNGVCDVASEDLQAKLNSIHTMKASFKQTVKAQKREVSHSSGTMALSRPGKFRWQTKSPLEQLVIADGQHLWIYDVDLDQVTVRKQEKGLGGTAALFLSGYSNNISQDFSVTRSQNGENILFDLIAKSNKANFPQIKLTFTANQLTALELYDQLGQKTYVTLSNIQQNPKLATTLFTFVAPKGVDVVRQ